MGVTEKGNDGVRGVTEKSSNSDVSVTAGHVVTTHEAGTITPPEYNAPPQFDEARTKKLLSKLDWHIVPFLALLYL